MKRLLFVGLIVLGCCGLAAADLLEGFESSTTTWTQWVGGGFTVLQNSTEDPFAGERSLKMVDSNTAQPYVGTTNGGYGNLTSLNDTYIELAFKTTGTYPSFATVALQFYIGTDSNNRTCWRINETVFQNVAPDTNGWYVLHFELSNGSSTITGSTVNGVEIGAEGAAWNSGSINWASINSMAFLLSQASGSDVWTSYVDQITINEAAIPEPVTMAVLGLGGLFLVRRRK